MVLIATELLSCCLKSMMQQAASVMSIGSDVNQPSTSSSSSTLPQHSDASAGAYRDAAGGPLRKLSVDLIKTYKHINEVSACLF